MERPQGAQGTRAVLDELAAHFARKRPLRDEARSHAITASEMLDGITRFESQLGDLTPEERLHVAATGGFTRANADLQWTVEVALAHALTAIALELTSLSGDREPSGNPTTSAAD